MTRWAWVMAVLLASSGVLLAPPIIVGGGSTAIQGWLDCPSHADVLVFYIPSASESCNTFNGSGLLLINGTYVGSGETILANESVDFLVIMNPCLDTNCGNPDSVVNGVVQLFDVTTGQTVATGQLPNRALAGTDCATATRISFTGVSATGDRVVSNGDSLRWRIAFSLSPPLYATVCSQSSFMVGFSPVSTTSKTVSLSLTSPGTISSPTSSTTGSSSASSQSATSSAATTTRTDGITTTINPPSTSSRTQTSTETYGLSPYIWIVTVAVALVVLLIIILWRKKAGPFKGEPPRTPSA